MQGLPALPAGSTILPHPAGSDDQEAQQVEMGSLVVLSRQGSVKGYSRAVVKVVFTPLAAGPVREQIRIHFRYLAMVINMQSRGSSKGEGGGDRGLHLTCNFCVATDRAYICKVFCCVVLCSFMMFTHKQPSEFQTWADLSGLIHANHAGNDPEGPLLVIKTCVLPRTCTHAQSVNSLRRAHRTPRHICLPPPPPPSLSLTPTPQRVCCQLEKGRDTRDPFTALIAAPTSTRVDQPHTLPAT